MSHTEHERYLEQQRELVEERRESARSTEERDPMTQHETLYLDYVNNFLTLAAFAEYYGMTESEAADAVDIGRRLNKAEGA